MSSTVAVPKHAVNIDLIDVGENVRELDEAHVQALASSIALRGLINPVVLRPDGERFRLIAGHHRYAAYRKLGMTEIEFTLREQEGSSADSAAENVLRKQLSPLEEARAVQNMLDEGYNLDGAAEILGWSPALVKARAKILELPEIAQNLLGNRTLPVSAVSLVAKIAQVSPAICDATLAPIANGEIDGERFVDDPGRTIGSALKDSKVFAAYLITVVPHAIAELRLGKKTEAAFAEAEQLHRQLDAYAYGPPTIRFSEIEVDQARAAGVLIEFEQSKPIITDQALYRELTKQAIIRTVGELRTRKEADDTDRAERRASGKPERTPQQKLEAEHRAKMRALTVRAHSTNLDLGSALLQNLAVVDPGEMDVARFFAYGILGPDGLGLLGKEERTVATIAANGIRLVFDQHRTTTTPKLKSGGWGKTKVTYGEIEDAAAWLWKFLDGAKTAGELYGRTLVVFASQHYAQQLVLAASKRRSSVLPYSHKDIARKAFERITKKVLPGTHVQLARAIERETREYTKRQVELGTAIRQQHHDAEHDSAPDGAGDSAEKEAAKP